MNVAVGDVVAGKYRVERTLGEGAMGVVVEVMHVELGKRFAIKVMKPAALAREDAIERFLREARAAARLQSVHTCQVVDVDRFADGTPYLVMELLEGEDLQAFLARSGPLPVGVAARVLRQVCVAIGEAHAVGIVHRDLKPQNLFRVRGAGGDTIKVLDFGVSKIMETVDLALTGESMIGSPAYMSPEQLVSSSTVDGRADLWSLGVVLFQLVTGRLPFEATSIVQQVALVTTATPPAPSTVSPGLDPRVDALVARLLERDLARRVQTAGELADALAPLADDTPWPVRARAASPVALLHTISAELAPTTGLALDATVATGAQERPAVATPATSAPRRRRWPVVAALVAATAGAGVLGYRQLDDAPSTVTSAPAPTRTPRQRAREHRRRTEYDAARKVLADAIAATPDDATLRLELAMASLEVGARHIANEQLAHLETQDARLAPLDRELLGGVRALARGDHARAAEAFAAVMERDPRVDHLTLLQAARAYVAQSAAADIARLRARAPEEAAHPTVLLYEADVLRDEPIGTRPALPELIQRYQRAAEAADAHGLGVVEARARHRLAFRELEQGDVERAAANINRAIARLEGTAEIDAVVDAHNARGLLAQLRTEHQKAHDAFDTALSLATRGDVDPRPPQLNRACTRVWLGRLAEARAELAAAKAGVPVEAAAYVNLCLGWERIIAGDLMAARPLVAAASDGLRGDPWHDAPASVLVAALELAAGEPAKARAVLERALHASPKLVHEPLVRVRLAAAALALGALTDAEAHARTAMTVADRLGFRDLQVEARRVLAAALAGRGAAAEATALRAEVARRVASLDNVPLRIELRLETAARDADGASLDAIASEARGAGFEGLAVSAEGERARLANDRAALTAALAAARRLGQGALVQRLTAR